MLPRLHVYLRSCLVRNSMSELANRVYDQGGGRARMSQRLPAEVLEVPRSQGSRHSPSQGFLSSLSSRPLAKCTSADSPVLLHAPCDCEIKTALAHSAYQQPLHRVCTLNSQFDPKPLFFDPGEAFPSICQNVYVVVVFW